MRRSGNRYGLPPEIAATDHLGKQLDRKRRAEAKATRLVRAEQAPLDFHAALPLDDALPADGPVTASEWFEFRGWQPFAFQREVWARMGEGKSGLLHASTGTGKTYAVWLGALDAAATPGVAAKPLTVLWITPMRALPLVVERDTTRAVMVQLAELVTGTYT